MTARARESDTGNGFAALDDLATDVGAYLDRKGIARTNLMRVAKVGEEGGEVVGALIKSEEGRVPFSHVIDELGDVLLAALGAADHLGLKPSEIIANRWRTVSQR